MAKEFSIPVLVHGANDSSKLRLHHPVSLLPLPDGSAEVSGGSFELAPQLGDFFSRRGNSFFRGQQVFVLSPFPVFDRLAQSFLGSSEHDVRPFRKLDRLCVQLRFQLPLFFRYFPQQNFFDGNTAQLDDKSQPVQQPDGPFGGIKLPGLHSIAVVALKLVVKIVVTLAESKQGHPRAVACGAAAGIRLFADRVAKRIDEKSHVLDNDDAGHSRDQETAQRGGPSAPRPSDRRGQREAGEDGDEEIVAVLPQHQPVLLQVGYLVVQARLRFQLEENPADVGVEKAFREVIRIVVLIHKFMVTAMVGGPVQDRVFESGGAKQQREQAHRPARLKCSMGKEAMVAERDAEAGAPKKDNEQRYLKPIQAIAPQIGRNRGQRCEQRADQKQAVLPVNGLPENTIHTKFCFNTRRYD